MPQTQSEGMIETKKEEAKILHNKIILISDDDPIALKHLANYLKILGARAVETAINGEEMLNKFISYHQLSGANSKTYDLLITDINMPILTGSEAAQKIRIYEKENNLRPTPIIATTGNEENLLTFYKSGINDCFAKGDDLDKMCQKMSRTIGIWVD